MDLCRCHRSLGMQVLSTAPPRLSPQVMFELVNQMRSEDPSPIGPVGDLFPPGSQESKKVITHVIASDYACHCI